MDSQLNQIAAKTLGSANSYAVYTDQYDATLLNPMPRSLARDDYGITNDSVSGVDVWHCWETSFLLDNGAPVSGVTKFIYSANSDFMVESKSAKLFFNSFDMCKMGATKQEAIEKFETVVKQSLEAVLGTVVQVRFFDVYEPAHLLLNNTTSIDYTDVAVTDYTLQGNHLQAADDSVQAVFHSLRSRCRHTKQKDTGTAYIEVSGVDRVSLFKHLCSFRDKDEFHEFCADKLLVDLRKYDANAVVALFYHRRGSLDITPIRFFSDTPEQLREFLDINNLIKGNFTQ